MKVADLRPASSPAEASFISTVEAAALRPAQVHAQEDLRPVLGVGAPRPGVDGDDRVTGVVLAAEQSRLLKRIEARFDRRQLRGQLGPQLLIFSRHLGQIVEVGDLGLAGSAKVSSLRCGAGVAADARRRGLLLSQKPGRCISASAARQPQALSEAGSKVVREQLQLRADSASRAGTDSVEAVSATAQFRTLARLRADRRSRRRPKPSAPCPNPAAARASRRSSKGPPAPHHAPAQLKEPGEADPRRPPSRPRPNARLG